MTHRVTSQSGPHHAQIERMENRTLLSGALDPTFGTGGYTVGPTTAPTAGQPLPPVQYQSVLMQADRKITAGGLTCPNGVNVVSFTRYNINGSVDSTFGNKGVSLVQFGGLDARSLTAFRQYDGKIDAAVGTAPSPYQTSTGITVFRLNADGSIDTSFGTAGKVAFSDADSAPSLVWQNKKILLGDNTAVRRLNLDGTVDGTFHAIDPTYAGTHLSAVYAVQPNQKLLIDTADFNGAPDQICRYNADGTLDKTFGASGFARGVTNGFPVRMLVENNGTILELAAQRDSRYVGASVITALTPLGQPDTGFGEQGSVILPASPNVFTRKPASAIFQQPDGHLLVVSPWHWGPSSGFDYSAGVNVTRYSSRGIPDLSFGGGGYALQMPAIQTGPAQLFTYDLSGVAALDGNGRLLLAGTQLTNFGGASLYAMDLRNDDTGTITGQMFNDTNGNGKLDPGETPLNWSCYIDRDNNGKYDNADVRISTNQQGQFTIPNLPAGIYHVRQSGVAHWKKTTPADYTVTVKAGATVTGINFGSQFTG